MKGIKNLSVKHLKFLILPGEKLSIKIVATNLLIRNLEPSALGVTPAHSQIDWEIAQRHNLPSNQL